MLSDRQILSLGRPATQESQAASGGASPTARGPHCLIGCLMVVQTLPTKPAGLHKLSHCVKAAGEGTLGACWNLPSRPYFLRRSSASLFSSPSVSCCSIRTSEAAYSILVAWYRCLYAPHDRGGRHVQGPTNTASLPMTALRGRASRFLTISAINFSNS